MSKKDQLILIVGILLIIFGIKYLTNKAVIPAPQPNPPVVIPDNVIPTPPAPVVPEPIVNIFHDECEKANKLSKQLNRPLILIFGASWCPYCKDLKADLESIKQLDATVVCVIDIEKNKNLVDKYKIKGLPTSVIVKSDKEQSRHSGYKRNSYETWLNGTL